MKKDTSIESYGASTGLTPPATDNLGKVEISPEAIATIASQVALETYGVVGMATRRLRGGKAEALRPEHYREGIQVRFEGDQIMLDLYVIIEYGNRISEIAHNIMSKVKFEVERHLGREVAQVNVNVQGLRMPEQENSTKRSKREHKE